MPDVPPKSDFLVAIAAVYERRAIALADTYKEASDGNAQYGKEWAMVANMLTIAREIRFIASRPS